MKFFYFLEQKLARYIPEGITKFLLAGQVISFIIAYSRPDFSQYFYLSGSQLYTGEVWRLVLVLFTPVSGNILFLAIAWYFFYYFSTQLENYWGSFRYLIYVLISYLATVIFALLFPGYPVTSLYIYTTLFLAFAQIYPDFRVLLFFIIPVKLKWLGIFAWLSLFFTFISGPFVEKVFIIFSVLNFFIFFNTSLISSLRSSFNLPQTKTSRSRAKPLHVCDICGQNEIDNPDMEIRYCTKCNPQTCYCGHHINKHQHKRSVN